MIPKSHKHKVLITHALLTVLISLFLVIIVFASYTAYIDKKYDQKIYPRVQVDGYDVSNMTKAEALTYLKSKPYQLENQLFHVLYHNEPIATFSAAQIHVKLNTEEVIDRAYYIGRVNHLPSRIEQKFATLFGFGRYNFATELGYDIDMINDFVSSLQTKYEKPSKNALFTFENGRVSAFQDEQDGLELLTTTFITDLHNQIQSIKYMKNKKDFTITLQDRVVVPEVTLAQSNSYGIEELIGEGQSDYTGSIPGRVHNVILGTSKMNGILIPKGETLSFNDKIGDISALTGYQPAYIIQNGKTILGDGGGICQVSTTLFRAALNTGLPIVSRTAHAYRVHYYENDMGPGYDATIFSPSVDLKIKNDTPAAILIQTDVDETNRIVHFRIYGKKDNRKVEISKAEVWDIAPPPDPSYEDDPTLARGITKQVDFSAWGAKARFNYRVTYQNNEIKEQTFYSVYRPWRAVFLVGTKDG